MKTIRPALLGMSLAAVLAVGDVHAQVMCSLGTASVPPNHNLDEPPSPRADRELRRIYGALCAPRGCGTYVLVSNPTVPNAMATVVGVGRTKISYRPVFMDQTAFQYGPGATFGILAHEFGHHIDLQTTPPWMNTSWSRELKADAWAGCALARTGVSTSNLENALVAIAAFPSPSHPPWQVRSQSVRTGFVNCGGLWPNSGPGWPPGAARMPGDRSEPFGELPGLSPKAP